jgi:hypothetical protein
MAHSPSNTTGNAPPAQKVAQGEIGGKNAQLRVSEHTGLVRLQQEGF